MSGHTQFKISPKHSVPSKLSITRLTLPIMYVSRVKCVSNDSESSSVGVMLASVY